MQVDEQKLLQLIGDNPMIRTVQLAERLDCDIEDVVDALIAQTNRGRVLDHQVMAPNNRRATAYTLSSEFRGEILRHVPGVPIDPPAPHIARAIAFVSEHGTVTGAQLHACLELDPAATPSHVLAEALADGRLHKDGKYWTLGAASRCMVAKTPEPAAPDITSKMMPKIGKRPQRGIDFIVEHGRATDAQLAIVMQLRPGDPPEAWLREAVKYGVVTRDGADWIPGGRKPEPAAEVAKADPLPAPVPASIDQEPLDAPIIAAAPAVEPPAAPVAAFRCGLWSDGVLELRRDGQVIAALSPDEREQVAQFLGLRAA